MSRFERITIREVESSDLDTFYEHEIDPEVIRMAAFIGKDPKDKAAFHAHWDKIWHSARSTNRTIVSEGRVAGHIACFPDGANMEVTYWLGRDFWGRGLCPFKYSPVLNSWRSSGMTGNFLPALACSTSECDKTSENDSGKNLARLSLSTRRHLARQWG